MALNGKPMTCKVILRGSDGKEYVGLNEGRIIAWMPESLNKNYPLRIKQVMKSNMDPVSQMFKKKSEDWRESKKVFVVPATQSSNGIKIPE
jgi:ABC-type Mn2+/Zn2+ transport system ATPase subunit